MTPEASATITKSIIRQLDLPGWTCVTNPYCWQDGVPSNYTADITKPDVPFRISYSISKADSDVNIVVYDGKAYQAITLTGQNARDVREKCDSMAAEFQRTLDLRVENMMKSAFPELVGAVA